MMGEGALGRTGDFPSMVFRRNFIPEAADSLVIDLGVLRDFAVAPV